MTLLEQLREIGLPMGGRYAPVEVTTEDEDGEELRVTYQRHVGWTKDEAKATAAREIGASVTHYRALDARFNGWEVSVNERL